jgi:hypothetical protein
MRSRSGAVVGLYALLALLAVPVFPHFLSPNEFTRWALAASLVERGTLEISSALPLLGPTFEDVSEKEGRVYSNKAPGATLVALPGYVLARGFSGPPSPSSMRPVLWAMRLFGATLPLILLAALLVRTAARLGGETSRAPLVLCTLLFGTPLFAYGLLLFAHALVAFCLFAAWACLFVSGNRKADAATELVAGALIGLAVASEYPAAVPGALLVACASWRRSPARLARIVAGGLPFAVALGLYDRACFGGVFEVSAAHERFPGFAALRSHGLFGIGLPSAANLLSLLFDPSKGLLVLSPILALALLAFPAASRVLPRPASAALVLVPLSLLLLYAGFPDWHGGFNVGVRYLMPAVPFVAFPLFFRGGGRLEAALVGASVAAVTLTTLAFPFVPPGFPLPWGSFALHFLERGLVGPNVLHLVWRPLAIAVPLALVVLAASTALTRRRAYLILGATVAVAVGGAMDRAVPLRPFGRLQRAYIEDVYFDQRGTLEEEIARTGSPQPRLLARRERELALPPPPWPFRPASR